MMPNDQIQPQHDAFPTFSSGLRSAVEPPSIHAISAHPVIEPLTLDIKPEMLMASQLCDTPSIHECNASLSPWEQLPTELIRAIVRLSVSPHLCFPLEHGRRDPHLQITQICSSWRAIACSMSNLWGLTFYQDLILESSIELATSLLN